MRAHVHAHAHGRTVMEVLENRLLMDGAVLASLVNGALLVMGDSLANQIAGSILRRSAA